MSETIAEPLAGPPLRYGAGLLARLPRGASAVRAYWIVVVFSLAVRLLALIFTRHAPFVSDAHDYVEMAGFLWQGVHFVPYWPPGLPLYLAPVAGLGGSILAIRASMLLFWLLATWGLYRLARALGLAGIAWLVLLVLSIMPGTIHMSIEPATPQPVAAFLLIALGAAILAARTNALKEYVLLGVSLACVALTRPSALPLLALLPLATYLCCRASPIRTRVAGPLLSIALGGALVGGWIVRSHTLGGLWIINSSNAINFYYGNDPWTPLYQTWYFGSHSKAGTTEAENFPGFEKVIAETGKLPPLEASRQYEALALQSIRERPGLFVFRTLNRIQCFFGFDIFTSANLRSSGGIGRRLFPISLLMEAGLYLLVAAPAFFWLAAAGLSAWRRWETILIAGVIVVYAAPYWLSMSHPTYHYPIVAPLALLGLFAWKCADGLSSRRRGWAAVALLAVIQVVWVWQMAGSSRLQ